MTTNLGSRRPTRLSCQDHANAERPQLLRKQRCVGRFARPFAAFEGYESASHLGSYNFGMPARINPMTSSAAASQARR